MSLAQASKWLTIRLLTPRISFSAFHAKADNISNRLEDGRRWKESAEVEAMATQISPSKLIEVEGVEGSLKADSQLSKQRIN